MSRRTFPREIIVLMAFFGLTALMTWPWILHLRDAVSDRGDCYLHTYFMWWDYHQTFHNPLNLFNATIFYPYKQTLAFSENDYGIALIFFPLYALGFRPITVHSVATLTAFAFSGYGMFRVTRTLTDSRGAAWVAGIVFAFLPYHFQRLPHLPLIFAGWIPLLLEALVLFARQRTWRRATWLSVAFLMNALTCVTWFILTLIPFALSAVFLLWWLRLGRDRAFWIRGGTALGLAGLAVLGFLFPYYNVHGMYGFVRSAGTARDLSAYPIHWLTVSARNKLWKGLGGTRALDELPLFPGILPPLLAWASFFLVAPVSRQLRALKLPKTRLLIPRRVLALSLDILAFAWLLLALLTLGYGSIHIRLFGFELLRSSHPIRPLIFFLATLCIRFLVASPEIVRRIVSEKNLIATFRSNPRVVALVLGVIWALTGFLGSFGMNFFFHRWLFEFVLLFRSMRVPARWAMICYVGLSILAGLGAIQIAELVKRWRPRVPRILVFVLLVIFILFEQRVAPIEFAHGQVDPDALTLRLKTTPMSGGIVELPAEKDNYAYDYYVLRAADHGRPIVTAVSSFAPEYVLEIESLTLARPIPDRFIDVMETIPTPYLVVHNSLLSAESRQAIGSLLARGIAAGRIRFINSYGNSADDSKTRDDLYAITKTEPNAQTETLNRIDETNFFVRQQFLDLLNREPDPAGRDNLVAFINSCNGEPNCLPGSSHSRRRGFAHLPEFQETSYFIYRLYKTAFGRMPKYVEWERDINRFSTDGIKTKLPFANEFSGRAGFLDHLPAGITNIEYVDRLLRSSDQKLTQMERKALIDDLNNGLITRADVLVRVADSPSIIEREFNEAFVAMCYFSYLKRDPDPEGYNLWLQTIKDKSKGENAVLRGFLYSGEYRARSGQP